MLYFPEICPICQRSFTPCPPLSLLYFKLPDKDRPENPFVVCDPCMQNDLRARLEDASPGRYDIQLDGTNRIAFSLERKPPFTRKDLEEMKEFDILANNTRLEFLSYVLPELKKRTRQLRIRPLCKPIPFDMLRDSDLQDNGCTSVESGSPCSPTPSSPPPRRIRVST
jgi:hypothetical protein